MIHWRETTKVFAFFFLFFAGFSVQRAQNSIYRLEPGTKIRVSMDNEINSKISGAGDTFTTTIAEPVKIREAIVLPVGTVIEGRVLEVEPASPGGKGGVLVVRFETIRFENGASREIEGVLASALKADSMQKANLWTILGGTLVGALVGAATQKSSGALIGAGVGAGIGAGTVAIRKGKDVRIKSDEKFEIELTKEVTLPVLDY